MKRTFAFIGAQAVGMNHLRPFEHRLKEKFHQFQFNFYKEREMSDFRKLLLAFAAATLMAGIASAQVPPPIVCSTTAQPLTVRAEGLAEQTGDIVISCTGGTVPALGSALPQVNISVTLTTNITSRLVSDPLTEALLFIDDPQPAAQSPCAGVNAVCAPLLAGPGGTAVDSAGVVRNIFQGTRQSDNTIVFLAIPINAPGTAATRVFRTKNIRAAIAGASAPSGQIFAFVSIQNPPANLQLNNSSVNVAFVQQGLLFAVRSRTGGSFDPAAAGVQMFQCDASNFSLAASATARYGGGGFLGRSFTARFRENYAASWKVRDVNFPLTEPGLQQNIPQNNNGADPSIATVVESGFYNTGFTSTNGLNRAGRADHGTRLRLAFSNVPANVRVYVSVHALSSAAFTTDSSNRQSGGGETSASTAAYGVSTSPAGLNVFAGTVLANPTSDTELVLGGNTARYPSGAVAGLIEVPLTGGAGSFVWEVFGQDPNQIDTASFAVSFAYRPAANPGTGTIAVNGSFAPVGGGNTMSATAAIPRFADLSTAVNSASIVTCLTTLLFPFVTNQAGFDTGVAIANTSADPFGTAPQTGNCELNYYGGTTGGGAAPARQTTTTPVAGGQTLAFTLSSGGTNGIAATPGFQGYIIAICNFRFAHGFAFISDVGAARLSHGYLALILDPRIGLTGEALNN
ncbi:MAG: hypothetical protein NZV14_17700 [Bryobacteraceae bacterium]|nr:hypothetical protein [Bryobacteraceae bacterium]MDW8379998.1 hypothetical protein [Bryobacterales bacterium]